MPIYQLYTNANEFVELIKLDKSLREEFNKKMKIHYNAELKALKDLKKMVKEVKKNGDR